MLKAVKNIFAPLALSAVLFSFAASVFAEEYVIPSGECIGVKLYTDGLIVVGTAEVTDRSGKTVDPSEKSGISKGDIIKKINGKDAVSNETVSEVLSSVSGDVTVTVEKNGKEHEVSITPADTESGPKLGLWLRDSTAGLGTLTYTTDTGFAALGHAICDVDTGSIMPIERGFIQNCTITSISKGKAGEPGAITGDINGSELGRITKNTNYGIFGELDIQPSGTPVPVADRSEVRTGDAVILADADGKGVKEYTIKIKRVTLPSGSGKDMVIEVTDNDLIDLTGGIVQGMSGAPILQNGKFVGAVTHVFVNDPLSGYAILAENMLNSD